MVEVCDHSFRLHGFRLVWKDSENDLQKRFCFGNVGNCYADMLKFQILCSKESARLPTFDEIKQGQVPKQTVYLHRSPCQDS